MSFDDEMIIKSYNHHHYQGYGEEGTYQGYGEEGTFYNDTWGGSGYGGILQSPFATQLSIALSEPSCYPSYI